MISFGISTWNRYMEKEQIMLNRSTDSFIIPIKTEGIYKDITEDVETRFDISNYEIDRRSPGENK